MAVEVKDPEGTIGEVNSSASVMTDPHQKLQSGTEPGKLETILLQTPHTHSYRRINPEPEVWIHWTPIYWCVGCHDFQFGPSTKQNKP